MATICDADVPHSTLEYNGYRVRLYGPNDTESPDIWEGPICITDTVRNSACIADLSLIKGVSFDHENNKLLVNVFSGSNEEYFSLSMDSCRK